MTRIIALVLLGLDGSSSAAIAQTATTYTYQGELEQDGSPARGSFSMTFSLWDALVDGNQVGQSVVLPGVQVSDGRFTVELDHGVGAFDNSPRWLEIMVDGVPLSPRQPITRTPYAMQTNGIVVNEDGYVGIGTNEPTRGVSVEGPGFPGAFLLLDSTPGGSNEDAGINLNRDDSIKWHLFNQGATDSFNLRNALFDPVLHAQQDRRVGIGMNTPSMETMVHIRDVTGDNFGVLVDSFGVEGSSIGLHVGPSGFASLAKNATFEPGWFRFDDEQGAFLQEIAPDGSVSFLNAPAGEGAIAWQTAMHITPLGKIGVGHASPTYQLDVETNGDGGIRSLSTDPNGIAIFGAGTVGLSGLTTVAGGAAVSGDAVEGAWAGYFDGEVSITDRVIIGGDAPITPASYLDVRTPAGAQTYGGMYVETADGEGLPFYGYATANVAEMWTYFNGQTGDWNVYHGGDRLTVESNGEVGINTTQPVFTLHVNGTAGKPGGGSWANASDRRLKKDVRSIARALDQLLALRGVTFEYKDPASINERAGRRVGMIAQEVEQVFPDWVDPVDAGYRTVTFRGFEALTVEALRELRDEKDEQIQTQAARIESLETENSDLADRLAALEAIVAELTAPR
jgi:hypothetical protein